MMRLLNVEGLAQRVSGFERFDKVLENSIAVLTFQNQCLQNLLLVLDFFVQQRMDKFIPAGAPLLDPYQGVDHLIFTFSPVDLLAEGIQIS